MFKKILCPLEGSTHAERALEIAIDLAGKYDASLILFHALLRNTDPSGLERFAEAEGLAEHVQPEMRRVQSLDGRLDLSFNTIEERGMSSQALFEIGRHLLENARSEAERGKVREISTVIADGDAATEILRCIDQQDVDCVVMGSRGLSDIKGLYLGSVSHKVTNRAPCTCIAVK